MTGLRRLILEFKPDGHELRVLYRRKDGPNPGTARRRKEVQDLAAEALERALEALKEGPVESVGESGFSVREDVLSLDTPWKEGNPMDGNAFAFACSLIRCTEANEEGSITSWIASPGERSQRRR